MAKKFKIFLIISLFSLLPTILIWIPFFFRVKNFWGIPLPDNGMATVVANFDGPLFIVIAKSFYNQEIIKQIVSFPLAYEYYAAHFPLYPFIIRIFSFVTGYPYAMLLVTLLSSIMATYFFYLLAKKYMDQKNALFLTLVFSVFPARWLIVRSVGSAEPLFIASILASIYYFKNKKYLMAGIWGLLAQLTKSPGILLFIAYLIGIIIPKIKDLAQQNTQKWIVGLRLTKYIPLLLIPVSLIGVFILYKIQFNNFFAYFNSGDNIHIFFPPYQIFNYSSPWVGTFWLEEIIFIYLLAGIGVLKLFEQKKGIIAWFSAVYFVPLLFVSHRDLLRYALPMVPFLLLGYANIINGKYFKLVFIILIIPIYLFSLVYISQNVMPISDWGPLL